MMSYRRVAVASNFSPTFADVLAEADRFARHHGAELDVLHVAEYDAAKEKRFAEALGRSVVVRWLGDGAPADAIAAAAAEYSYDLIIAGALQREDAEKPYTSGVARELLRLTPCDLLLIPGPSASASPVSHAVFVLEPGEKCEDFLAEAVRRLGLKKVTLAIADTPFAAALASSRGLEPCDAHGWSDGLADGLRALDIEAESWVVTSNTGYSLCDTVQGMPADLLVVRGDKPDSSQALPVHVNWLYQVIPMRLLVVRQPSGA